MKKLVKLFSVIIIACLLFSNVVLAGTSVASSETTMKLVEDNKATLTFGKYGWFEKKMENIDTKNKTIDLRFTVKNNAEEEAVPAGQVVLLIDNSFSMSDPENEVYISEGVYKTRKQLVIDSAKELVNKLYAANDKMEVGVVEFATNTDTSKWGTMDDAKVITQTLTTNKADVATALATVEADTMGNRTDIQAGLRAAYGLFATSTSDLKKYIVILTDAIPNVVLYEGDTTRNNVQDLLDKDKYLSKYADVVKKELQDIKADGVNVISMLINMSEINQFNGLDLTYKEISEYIFGTSVAPLAGPVYYVSDEEVEDTVSDNIYEDLIPSVDYNITDIVIKDYFPDNIVDNFTFSYVSKPDKGEISETIDKSDKSITWRISKLAPGETATFVIRLKANEKVDSSILNINLPTNKNVTIDYQENGTNGKQVSSDKCPIIMLQHETIKPKVNEVVKDNTTAPKSIPQTGEETKTIISSLILLSGLIGLASYVYYKKNRV